MNFLKIPAEKRKKALLVLAAAILLILAVFLIVRGCSGTREVSYQYDRISVGEVRKSISVSGKLDVLNSYTVVSKINGVASRVYVDYNQRVGKNQLLAVIDSPEIEQQYQRAAAQLDRARLDMEGARAELESKRALFSDNLIARKEFELSELNYKKFSAGYRQASVDYTIAQKNRGYARILSPAPGTVFSVMVKPMEPVIVNKPLFVIAEDLRKMYLTITIDESEIGRVAKGQSVTFTVSAHPGTTFKGKIDQVHFNPIMTGIIVTYQAIVICENDKLLLKPGMTATATIIVAEKKNVPRVPNEALIVWPVEGSPPPDKKFLWVKQASAKKGLPVKRVEVKTGLVGDTHTELILGAVKIGDGILVRANRKMKLKERF